MLRKRASLIKQILFFGVVGLLTLGIDVGVTTFLYETAHLPAYLASAIGFLSGFFFNFPMNRKKVFRHSKYDRFRLRLQVTMYIAIAIFNLIATSLIVELLVSTEILQIQYAKIAVTVMIALWNFLLFKLVVFSKRHK